MNALPAVLWIAAALCAVMVCAVTVYCSHFRRADVVVKPVSWAVIIGQLTTFVLFAMPYFLFLANKDSIDAHPRSLYERLGWPSAVVAVVLVFAELALMYVQARRAMRFEPAHIEPLPDDGDADGDETHEGTSII